MRVTVGTFNLNNLFSRYNFRAEVSELPAAATTLSEETTYQFGEGDTVKFRAYRGSLVTAKDPGDQATIAERVRRIDVDVLAVQEVEDIDTLKQFAREDLGGMYPHVALIEGNDPRLIDLG
ncbi:MAG: endonuclease/exonuclease/phosphatase family protein, partial [Pseudomonadota bacterium]